MEVAGELGGIIIIILIFIYIRQTFFHDYFYYNFRERMPHILGTYGGKTPTRCKFLKSLPNRTLHGVCNTRICKLSPFLLTLIVFSPYSANVQNAENGVYHAKI